MTVSPWYLHSALTRFTEYSLRERVGAAAPYAAAVLGLTGFLAGLAVPAALITAGSTYFATKHLARRLPYLLRPQPRNAALVKNVTAAFAGRAALVALATSVTTGVLYSAADDIANMRTLNNVAQTASKGCLLPGSPAVKGQSWWVDYTATSQSADRVVSRYTGTTRSSKGHVRHNYALHLIPNELLYVSNEQGRFALKVETTRPSWIWRDVVRQRTIETHVLRPWPLAAEKNLQICQYK